MHTFQSQVSEVAIPAGGATLHGSLHVPPDAHGLVLFAHGSGSSRLSPRNRKVADVLHDTGLGTLLFDLHSPDDESDRAYNMRLQLDIELLARRLRDATQWVREQPETAELPLGYFGASTGAAVAIVAAAAEGTRISAVVTRGGRTDLASTAMLRLRAPTLFIVGGDDGVVASMNLEAWAQIHGKKCIEIVPGAGHLFEEPGALENVAALAARWFDENLRQAAGPSR
jgi:putative phosphoribosyl transferase